MGIKKRVLIFHQSLAPYRVDLWNNLSRVYDLKLYFIHRNHLDQKFDQERLRGLLDFEPYYFDTGISVGSRALRWGFIRIIKKFKPNIVITYEYSQTTTAILFLKGLFGFKYQIYSFCDDSLHIAETCSGVRRIFRNFLANKLDGLILVNQDVANWYKQRFGGNKKRIVFPIIADEEIFRENLLDSLGRTNELLYTHDLVDKTCIFYIGRLVKIKGIDRLIESFYSVANERKNARLVIVGDGEERESLENLSEHLLIKNKVIFTGRFEGKALMAWYNLAQIFVLASDYEPFGAVVNEALMAGAYVICSSYAGAASLIEQGKNGDVFNPYNKEKLTELIDKRLSVTLPQESEIKNLQLNNMNLSFRVLFNELCNELDR